MIGKYNVFDSTRFKDVNSPDLYELHYKSVCLRYNMFWSHHVNRLTFGLSSTREYFHAGGTPRFCKIIAKRGNVLVAK